jgi:hypothetical protein
VTHPGPVVSAAAAGIFTFAGASGGGTGGNGDANAVIIAGAISGVTAIVVAVISRRSTSPRKDTSAEANAALVDALTDKHAEAEAEHVKAQTEHERAETEHAIVQTLRHQIEQAGMRPDA